MTLSKAKINKPSRTNELFIYIMVREWINGKAFYRFQDYPFIDTSWRLIE